MADAITALKSCPFCGKFLIRSEFFSTLRQDQFFHEETEDGADDCFLSQVSVIVNLDDRDNDRAAAWNRRASPAVAVRDAATAVIAALDAEPSSTWAPNSDRPRWEREEYGPAVRSLRVALEIVHD